MSYRIFADLLPIGSGPPRPTPEDISPVVIELPRQAAPKDLIEQELQRILDQPGEPGESVQSAFDRKEHALVALVVSLGRDERVSVMERITAGVVHDPIVQRMVRFTSERRNRILTAIARSDRRAR